MATDRNGPAKRHDLAHEAAAWIARRDRGLTAAEQDDFFQWLAADPRHGEWLAQHRHTVQALQSLAQWRPEHGARPNPDLLEPPRRVRWWLRPLPLAAAASVALGLGLWWLSREKPALDASVTAAAPLTEQRMLEDGSKIDLNRGAVVDVRFTAAERRVRLVRGEALFAVAKNARRPFIVQAGTLEIRAVGTAFNVNLQPSAVEVLVTEGTVALAHPAAPAPAPEPATLVAAGQSALVSLTRNAPPPHVVDVSREEIGRRLAWQPRQFEFNATPLAQVVAEFNRENRVKMLVDDPELAALPVGASLRSDNVEGFVRLLEASFHVQAERRDDLIVLRRAPADANK